MKRSWQMFIACIVFAQCSIYASQELKFILAMTSSIVTDAFQFDVLGNEDVSPEIQEIVNDILVHMGKENSLAITIKRMNAALREKVGNNCIATHNAIFINEQWLASLTYEQRRYVLAHEITHVLNKDTLKSLRAYGALWAGIIGAGILPKNGINKILAAGFVAALGLPSLAAYRRYQEDCAEDGAKKVVGFDPFKEASDNHDENISTIEKVWSWLCSWFDTHSVHVSQSK